MTAEIARYDLAIRRRSTAWYAIGMALYMIVIVALYPSFKHSIELNKLTQDNSPLAALFGATGTLTSPAGWLDVNAYANFLPLIMLLLTIGYGAAAIAGQNEDDTLGLLVVLPLSRRGILAGKVVAMVVQALVLTVVVAVCVYVGRAFEVTVDPGTSPAPPSRATARDRLRLDRDGPRRGDWQPRYRDRHRQRSGSTLLPDQLARPGGALDQAASVRVPLLLGRRQRPARKRCHAGSLAVLLAVGIAAAIATDLAFRRLDVR